MIDRIQFLPARRQKFIRAMGLSMQGPTRRESVWPPIILMAVLLWAFYNLFQ